MDNSAPYELYRLVKIVSTEICDPVEAIELSKALIKSSHLWTQEATTSNEDDHQDLLVAIASLSSEVLASSQSSVSKEALVSLSSASNLILSFMITHLSHENVKKFSLPLTALCTGSPSLGLKEKNKMVDIIQEAKKFPHGFILEKPPVASERPPKPPLPMAMQIQADLMSTGETTTHHDNSRPQTDLTSSLLQQLRSPLEPKSAEACVSDEAEPYSFSNKNIFHLRSINAADQLIKICLNLPELSKYIQQWENAINGGDEIPSTETKSQALSALLDDIEIAWKVLSLPILEPLTSDRLNETTKIVMACLVASVSVASMPGGILSDEMESISVEIVENSLELFNTILSTIRQSTRAGGPLVQNYIMMGAWVLTSGLLVQLASASAVDISSKRINLNDLLSHGLNLNKVQERFNVLSVALASEALTLSSLLVEDLATEFVDMVSNEEAATLDLFQNFKASQRVDLILNAVPLIPLLFNVAFVSFKKGLSSADIRNVNVIDSNITEVMSDEKDDEIDDDDDSEPLLGRWFEETLSLFPNDGGEKKAKKTKMNTGDRTAASSLLSKVEPSGFYVSLASHIFIFLNKHILSSEAGFMTNYMKNGLSEPQMTVLAEMIQDLEGVSEENYPEFTSVLSTFTHNILAKGLLTIKLQNSLLAQLGVMPWQESGTDWPLHVQPRALTILAHVLLLRQSSSDQQDLTSAVSSRPISNTYAAIWERVLSSLTEAIIEDEDEESNNRFEDLNIEHVQLLLFLFHALALMQKKQLLLYTSNCIIKISKIKKVTERQIMHTARLIMIFEYIMKNLYEPPKTLLDEVQHNIFKRQVNQSVRYHSFEDIENNSTKHHHPHQNDQQQQQSDGGPKFYNLFEVPREFSNEVPKLDGLALSFILSTNESLKYVQLYQALIENLSVAKSVNVDKKNGFLSTVQYCFSITMRVLQSLPPSVEFLESLPSSPYLNENGDMDTCSLLHSLILCHRLNEKNFGIWVKDSLVKQGQTTAKAEALLKNVTSAVTSFHYDLNLLKQLCRSLDYLNINAHHARLIQEDKMATFFDLMVLDATMVQLHWALDKARTTNDPNLKNYTEATAQILEGTLHALSMMSKSSIIHSIKADLDDNVKESLLHLLSITGTRCAATASLAMTFEENCPPALRAAIASWQDGSLYGFASLEESMKSGSSTIPQEVYLYSRINCHVSTLCTSSGKHTMISLKQNLYTTARFAKDILVWCPEIKGSIHSHMVASLFKLILDSTTEILSNLLSLVLEKHVGVPESDTFASKTFKIVLGTLFEIISKPNNGEMIDEKILIEIVHYMEEMLEKASGRATLNEFIHSSPHNLVHLLMSIARPDLSTPEFAARVLKFFNKLFAVREKNPQEEASERLVGSLAEMAEISLPEFESWLTQLVKGFYQKGTAEDNATAIEENSHLLHCLTKFIMETSTTVPEDVSSSILSCLIPMAAEILYDNSKKAPMFQDIMLALTTLASSGSGMGHVQLFRACAEWLQKCCKHRLCELKITENETKEDDVMVENACRILEYMSDVIAALKMTNEQDLDNASYRPNSPTSNNESGDPQGDLEADWIDELNEDDDSAADDSDDEGLNSKLCTFTQTQKEFMNQHWYHCHTCKMVDGVGVCTVCAKVCHATHDVTYSKHGSFFCDCGAKEDGSCQALVKRSSSAMMSERPSMTSTASNLGYEPMLPSSLRIRPTSPTGLTNLNKTLTGSDLDSKPVNDKEANRQKLSKTLGGWKELLLDEISHSGVTANLLETLKCLVPIVQAHGEKHSSTGRSANLKQALETLHTMSDKPCEASDQLMLPTLGSQEGAFENVRMSYSGEQGQTIRQLMNAHMVRRVVMCCLSSGKRQHLAVAHEKGKLTVLQLSALLKQADSSQKKLTLTRLASAPVPFTVLSIVSNACNEDYLAVTGLKDCHVLTLTSTGSVSDHLVLHPQLDANNFIIKAIWMPGSQTELALITADFVKVYDLGKDVLSPQYYFLVPSGKISDCTLAFMADGLRYVLIMSAAGHIHFQALSPEASAVNGPFYVTNTLDLNHVALLDNTDPDPAEGFGVSIYYSQVLQVLFFSYSNGMSFMASMTSIKEDALAQSITKIQVQKSPTSGGSGLKNNRDQPLCQWGEVAGHPGLITAFLQASNNPVVLMVRPDGLNVQEIKIGSKAKIVDMVAIRHTSSNQDQRTTLILLCEDGSLKIYMAGVDACGFWLSNKLHSISSILSQVKPPRKKRPLAASKAHRPQGTLTFPIDFFEHCSQINDVEYGGSDVLQVYNVQQVKHRLQTAACYIANTKPTGFSLEVTNNDNNMVMVGVRVMLGGVDVNRVPSFIEIHGRNLPVNLTRSRWFDFPLTREESLQSDKKMNLNFGPSFDPGGVNIVDSVQIYGKTKDAFGWPEDQDEVHQPSSAGGSALASTALGGPNQDQNGVEAAGGTFNAANGSHMFALQFGPCDKIMSVILEILEGCFTLEASLNNLDDHKATALEITTKILTIPASNEVTLKNHHLCSTLFPQKIGYHNHKDQTMLSDVAAQPQAPSIPPTDDETSEVKDRRIQMDVERFEKLILNVRSVAISRPVNLTKFAEVHYKSPIDFVIQLSKWFWDLLGSSPVNNMVGTLGQCGLSHVEATVHALIDILHAFTTVDLATVPTVSNIYVQFLIADNLQVSFAAKQAIIRVLRPRLRRKRVFIPSPPPGDVTLTSIEDPQPLLQPPDQAGGAATGAAAATEPEAMDVDQEFHDANEVGARALGVPPGGGMVNLEGIGGNLDALLGGMGGGGPGGGQNPDMPVEIDDEAMVELAIALSLQEQEQGEGVDLATFQNGLQGLQQGLQQLANLGPGLQGFPALQGLAGMLGGAVGGLQHEHVPEVHGVEPVDHVAEAVPHEAAGNYSDATASAPGSDDDEEEEEEEEEGSTAAIDGSALRTPPVEAEPLQPGSGAGSESGASVNESIVGETTISGRSSAYEAETGACPTTSSGRLLALEGCVPGGSMMNPVENEFEATNVKLHALRLSLLDQLVNFLPSLREVGGPRCIPFIQVILMLTTDLDGNEDHDCTAFDRLLNALIQELDMINQDHENKPLEESSRRSHQKEFQLVILRLFSVLMSRSKSWQQSGLRTNFNSAFVSKVTATSLVKAGCTKHCLTLLTNLLAYWKAKIIEENSVKVSSNLLKSQPNHAPPDMSPFFLKQYVKSHAHDVFEAYPQLLTEMALRLPYQYFKIVESDLEQVRVDSNWHQVLCEYMMTHQTPYVRRQVRKLMLFICGNKENYRELRDLHTLESHMKKVEGIIEKDQDNVTKNSHNLPYDTLLQLIEHLKSCVDVASSRMMNWQKYCMKNPNILPFLFQISFKLDDGVSPIILHLLQSAICNTSTNMMPGGATSSRKRALSPMKNIRKPKNTTNTAEQSANEETKNDAFKLIQSLAKHLSPDLIKKFVEKFLLECNTSSVRWQAHALIVTLQKNCQPNKQASILDVLWSLWPQLPSHGRKAAQFVDLLGFFSIKTLQDEKKIREFVQEAVQVLKSQNTTLATHPNSNIYGSLSQLVEFNGYYLESDPCLVCNNPEVPFSSFKLSTLKVDTKYTTTTQIVKLSTSHSISKISLRIGDLKRQKMVRTINIYYNNRSVQAVVELKNRPTMWHKARSVSLTAGQTEIKIEFPLPIVACNLMIEYADFYENIQASSETLQCPRCSASVPANPGVCSNCGENVFQCHKCRSINYDEKDPFLCNACGFCKYAKFEYTLTSRPCCAVDPIESEDDRKKAILSINSLLDKADRVYRQLIGNKPILESLLLKISESGISDNPDQNSGNSSSSSSSSTNHVNQWIQQLAQKYCGDCKSSFEELSKIIQKVMATRRELVAFDKKKYSTEMTTMSCNVQAPGRCFGCAAASVEHCLTLLRALATKPLPRNELYQQGLIQELMEFNLRRGNPSIRHEVRKLICLLTKDNREATNHLNKLLYDKVGMALKSHSSYPDLVESVRHEMTLLGVTVQRVDTCWEQRLRCVLKIFIMATNEGKTSPTVMEYVTLPCLKILHGLMRGPSMIPAALKKDAHRSSNNENSEPADLKPCEGISLFVDKWLSEMDGQTYEDWQKRALRYTTTALKSNNADEKARKTESRSLYLQEKYFKKWYDKTLKRNNSYELDMTSKSSWLKRVLFNPSSRMAREVACQMVENFCMKDFQRKKHIVEMLTSFLVELSYAGEAAQEFVGLYQRMISNDQWKFYLAIKGILNTLATLITNEIERLNQLEHQSLSSDLAQGFALKTLTDILASFLSKEPIKRVFKGRLLSTVLHGYLSLRRLVVQRTKLVDQTQEKMLELLEDMTSGTLEETKNFMAICVQTIDRYSLDDQLTPVFIFERLCNIIFPEETDTGEFFMTLEKDPQQEDFLQGRMLGNPYSSNDPDLGPNMREIKNKICTDCELVALLEDDNGMELLVSNKIISLDLPVKDVYQKVWMPVAQENEPMRVIYRMRGLLGDATEEFIETLTNKDSENQDEEDIYKMANVMSDNNGLKVMLKRLEHIKDTAHSKQLMTVLLKLFGYCVRVKKNREEFLDPKLRTIPILLNCVKLSLNAAAAAAANSNDFGSQSTSSGPSLSEQVLQIMEKLFVEATIKQNTIEVYRNFASDGVKKEDIQVLLEHAVNLKAGTSLHQSLLRVLPFLTYANEEKMALVIKHFEDVLDFSKFDDHHAVEDEAKMEAFVALCDGIERNEIGNTMKVQMHKLGIVSKCTDYITSNAPSLDNVLMRADDPFWKEFVSRPVLKYILRALAGLSTKHSPTQMALTKECIPILHQMEQVSTDEHVGSLAETVLESLKGHPEAEARVKEVRDQTKAEKKKLAMAMRAKQLKAFGLKANDQGQVKAADSLLQQFVDLAEESGLCCNICREGYKFQPNKVLAIYTYTRPCSVDDGEVPPPGLPGDRRTPGYSTVTHFNLVHVDCHMAALRLQRGRDEWESAMLQNANTRCNGLLPLWGPQVPESAFASSLARHNTYLYEATRHRDIGYQSTIHDLKLLLLRFAQDKSFSSESGGGGPQSNMNLVPYLVHMALYVLNTTRAVPREEKNLTAFLEIPKDRWLENSFVSDGPMYYAATALLIFAPSKWKRYRVTFLQRLLLMAHARAVSPKQRSQKLTDKNIKEYSTYKLVILYFALIDQLYEKMFVRVPNSGNEADWPSTLADWIRHNDDVLIKASGKVLSAFQEDLLPATSVDEIIDVCGLMGDIPSPTSFLIEILSSVP